MLVCSDFGSWIDKYVRMILCSAPGEGGVPGFGVEVLVAVGEGDIVCGALGLVDGEGVAMVEVSRCEVGGR